MVMKIGFFDSGLGGLLIAQSVAKYMPQYEYVYFGDTANLPYGDKNEVEILKLTTEGVEYLFKSGCGLVVIACNTASAETLRKLQDDWLPFTYPERRILGVIIPTLEYCVEQGVTTPLLIATKRTVASQKYEREIALKKFPLQLIAVSTPYLVPLIEAGDIDSAVAMVIKVVEEERNRCSKIDSIILGCTHYSVLAELLRAHYQDVIEIIPQTEIIPCKLFDYIDRHPELQIKTHNQKRAPIIMHLTKERPEYAVFLNTIV